MAKYRIIYDRESCIGAAACAAVAPELWELKDDNKADLLKAAKNPETGKWELIVDDSQIDIATVKESADVCPVDVIKIEKIED